MVGGNLLQTQALLLVLAKSIIYKHVFVMRNLFKQLDINAKVCSSLTALISLYLYNNPSYSCILIGSRL